MKENVWSVTLMLISTGVASIGGYVGLSQYMSARPSVFVNVADVAVVPRKPPRPASLLARLRLIENRHRAYTGSEIVDLIQTLSEGQDDADVITKELKNLFLDGLADAIKTFDDQGRVLENLAKDLQSVAGNLDRPDFGRESLIDKLNELEDEYGTVTGHHIITLISDIEQQGDAGHKVDQKSRLSGLVLTFEGSHSNILSIISDLEGIKADVDLTKDDEKRRQSSSGRSHRREP